MIRGRGAVLAAGLVAALALAGLIAAQGDSADGGPSAASTADTGQPIAYPHNVHAGQLEIPCMYCHYSADRSVDAGIPPVASCIGCHAPGGAQLAAADRPEVQKLIDYWNRGEPIPWVRIHDLPDHAHFPHYMHVNAGLTCQECHGQVQEVGQVEQESSLRMGWCVECHRARGARTDCSVCHY
ncbi:MAG TPA: cytochrome c3 family protein [Longimicrobiales bacterium]|nr:cytochrome c3 family protein [Longimicrobiales bacterium]